VRSHADNVNAITAAEDLTGIASYGSAERTCSPRAECHGEELEASLMLPYSNEFMEKLVMKFRSCNRRMVKEESITSTAVIAGVIEKEFSAYYDL